MPRLLVLVALAGLGGCASAGQDQPVDASSTDAPADAPSIDAPTMVTLSQTSNMTIGPGLSLACSVTGMQVTRENSWYRVFPLTEAGITGLFRITQVAFAVESAGPAAQMVELRIGTYAGTPGPNLDLAMIAPLETVMVTVPVVSTPQFVSAPVALTVPANNKLVIEVFAPDGQPQARKFYPGSTAGTETAPGYLRGPDCGITQPRSMKLVASEAMTSAGSLIIEVTGTH